MVKFMQTKMTWTFLHTLWFWDIIITISSLVPQILPIIINDCIDSVRYGDDGTIFKLLFDCMLNKVVCFEVYGRSGFIQHKNLTSPQ